jgi:hypothetical protein
MNRKKDLYSLRYNLFKHTASKQMQHECVTFEITYEKSNKIFGIVISCELPS